MNRATRIVLGLVGGVVAALILAVLIVMIAVDHSHRELKAYEKLLEERGEHLDVARLAPAPAPVEGNGAPVLLAAARELTATADPVRQAFPRVGRETAPGRMSVVHRESLIETNRETLTWEEARRRYQTLFPLLAAIRAGANSPVLEVYPDYKGVNVTMVGSTETLRAGQYLNFAEGLLLIRDGRIPEAIDNIETTFRLADMAQRQNILISSMIAASLVNMAQVTTWEILQSPEATEADLARLQRHWENQDITNSIPAMLRLERAWTMIYYDEIASAGSFSGGMAGGRRRSILPGSWQEAKASGTFMAWKTFYQYADQKQALENFQELIDAMPANGKEGPWNPMLSVIQAQETRLSEAGISRYFSKTLFLSLKSAVERLVSVQAVANLTSAAIGLHRYRLSHGDLPTALAEISPGLLPKIPQDPFDGQPLRYRRVSDREFFLYAIGPDQKDDHGNPDSPTSRRRTFIDGRDIVWPLPALGGDEAE